VAAIRSSRVEGTFNLVDFTTKKCVAVPHTEIDAELLAAGMSLSIFMPPLRRDGHVWTDAVWVQDANIGEALHRGADESGWCGASATRRTGVMDRWSSTYTRSK
jgi:NTE family protein